MTDQLSIDGVAARLRAAGSVFAEDEAAILWEASTVPAGCAGTGRADMARADAVGADPVLAPTGRLDLERLEALVAARAEGRPLEHLVGWAELDGHRWAVAAGVFVPRRRSGLLVREAAARAVPTGSASRAAALLVDLCCGCGALGGAVAARLLAAGHDVEVHAADVDPVAVSCAHDNLKALADDGAALGAGRLTAHTYTGDLAEPLPADVWGRVDVLVANAPYVPTDAIGMMPPEAREHEPHVALDGGDDGLTILRRVIDLAPALLRPGGHLLVEVGETQVSAAVGHMEAAGLTPTVLSDEDLGATALAAALPPR